MSANHIEFAKSATREVGGTVFIGAVVAKVGIPMAVAGIVFSNGEDNLLECRGMAQHVAADVGGGHIQTDGQRQGGCQEARWA